MANKTTDVDLRIRAKNLSKAALKDIASDIDRISAAQDKQAKSSAALTARTQEELREEAKYLEMAQKELDRRLRLTQQYKEQRAEIAALAAKLKEMTAVSRQAASGQAFGDPKQFARLTKDVLGAQAQLSKLVGATQRTAEALADAGVDVDNLDRDIAGLNNTAAASSAAYTKSTAAINSYSAAVERSNAVTAEAQRRLAAETAARERAAVGIAKARNRSGELVSLRRDIEERSEAAAKTEILAEAQRRLAAESEREAAARRRNIETVVAEKNRSVELDALKRDIIARSSQAATATARETAALDRSAQRRERLVALLNTERGQKILESEATRRNTAEVNKNTGAKDRNAAATRKAADSEALFADTGRKSLSTYQRVRGQVLGLITAYVGVYEAINTVRKAIDATNRDQSLRAGLLTGSGGDQAEAAKNYAMIRKEADRLGLVFDDVAPRFVNMDIAGRAAGLTANQTAQAFRNLSTAAAARNLSLDDTEGAFRAIEQMFSKGRVQAEELRGQLAERLPGAVAIFARANNMSLAQLDKALEKGQVGLDFVVNGLKAYSAQFDGQLDVITSRLSAYINRAKNSYNDWLRTLLDGSNQTRLKEALGAVAEFFSGKQGEEFAKSLGQALAAVIEAFIVLARNADKLMTVFKAFLALQATKFLIDIAGGAAGAAKSFTALAAATKTAAAGTGAMSIAARAATPLFGPLGVAIAAVTGIVLAYSQGVEKAKKDTESFIDAMNRARNVKTIDEVEAAQKDLNKQLEESETRLRDLVKLQDATNDPLSSIANPLKALSTAQTAIKNDTYTRGELENNITNELARQEALNTQLLNLGKRKNQIAAEGADAARAAAMETVVGTGTAAAAEKDKTPKGPDPESVRDRILKVTEDLRGKLANVEIQANARTAEQIEANYQSRLEVIKSEVAKAGISIDAMQRDAARANKGKGTDVTTELTTARGALEAYAEAAREAAERDRTVANIELREKNINLLVEERDAKLQLINTLMQNGAITTGQAWQQTIATTKDFDTQIRTAATEFLAFLQAIPPDSDLYSRLGIAKTIAGMQQLKAETTKTLSTMQQLGMAVAGDFAQGTASALVDLGKGLAGAIEGANSLGDAFKGAMTSFRNFAADFLLNIAQMIMQAILLQAIQNAISGGSGGYFGAIKGVFGVKHEGGLAGSPGRTRTVNPAAFIGAQRFHTGSPGVGLKPNEIPTILEKGEEVLTEDNPRHISNAGQGETAGSAGGSGAPQVNVQPVVLIDSAEVIQSAMSRPEGQQAVMTFLKANKGAVNAVLGSK